MIKEEDGECESVTEAKGGQSKIKKVNVMEAIAKYNERKQQEKMELESTKPKETKEENKEDKKETFNKRHKHFSHGQRRHQNNSERKNQDSAGNAGWLKRKHETPTFSEKMVGITEFVVDLSGFSAILKQRYSDFQVNEVDLEGNVVHLTDQSIPPEEKIQQEVLDLGNSLLTTENWEAIDEVMKTEGETTKIDVSGKSKEERLSIHRVLRAKYEGIVSNTKMEDGKSIMEVSNIGNKKRETRWNGPAYTQFVLYKENTSTVDAINDLARKLKMKSGNFQYAGTKDKRAITSQLVTASKVLPKRLLGVRDNRYAFGNFSYVNKPLRLGALKGNRFRIVLRNVDADEDRIRANMESLEKVGFINYYGAQRFGTRHVPTHLIGKELILGRWQQAIDLILKPPDVIVNYREEDLVSALREWEASRDASKAHLKLQRNKFTIEGQLLFNLKKMGNDLVGALQTIPRNLRLTYLHAYQSYVWNTMVSKRIARYGLQPVVGDLVYPREEEVEEELEDAADGESGTVAEDDKMEDAKEKKKVQPLVLDESNVGNYNTYDVVLPLPGYDVIYPANEVAQWYNEQLETDEMSGFKQNVKDYNLGGAYRRLLCKPLDLQWKCARYNDPTLSLVRSDWDRFQGTDPHPGVEDGVYGALIVEFTLPASAYATMALREVTKMDMSPQFQSTLNDAGTSKQQEPESKRIKEDDGTQASPTCPADQ